MGTILLDHAVKPIIDDPALAAAPVARRLAHAHCTHDPSTGESCAWYHGPRLAFRALGITIGKGPREQTLLAGKVLLDMASGRRRVLVAGTADYSFAAVVAANYRAASAPLALTVVDRCETPLRLVEWYARRVCLDVATVRADLTEIDDLGPFDLICSDAVLAHVAPVERGKVVASWHGLLGANGRVMTLIPVRARDPSEEEWAARTASIMAQLRVAIDRGVDVGYTPAELVEALAELRARARPYAIRTVDEVDALFAEAGLAVTFREHDGTVDTSRRGSRYVVAVATRR
jgi:hypothetical protein